MVHIQKFSSRSVNFQGPRPKLNSLRVGHLDPLLSFIPELNRITAQQMPTSFYSLILATLYQQILSHH